MKKLLSVLFAVVCVLSFAQQKFTILLDAGHGGEDTGAREDFAIEKDINLDIATYIYKLNTNEKLDIQLIRTDDEFVDLKKRIAIAKEINPDLLISIHCNTNSHKNGADKEGAEIYISDKNKYAEKSLKYAEQLQPYLQKDAPIRTMNFMINTKTDTPAMTVEVGFLTNEKDRAYLSSKEGKIEIAKKFLAYFDALVETSKVTAYKFK